jgi:hypothetical protein
MPFADISYDTTTTTNGAVNTDHKEVVSLGDVTGGARGKHKNHAHSPPHALPGAPGHKAGHQVTSRTHAPAGDVLDSHDNTVDGQAVNTAQELAYLRLYRSFLNGFWSGTVLSGSEQVRAHAGQQADARADKHYVCACVQSSENGQSVSTDDGMTGSQMAGLRLYVEARKRRRACAARFTR